MSYRFVRLCAALVFLALPAVPLAASATSVGIVRGFAPIQSMLAPKTVRKLYVADTKNNAIDLFPAGVAQPKQIGAITKGIGSPVDVFVDGAGTLYVANASPATVTEYAAGSSVPKLTLSLRDLKPLYITVGPDGTVYVMSYNRYQRWRVVEFDAGAKAPSRKIDIPYEYPYPLVGGGIAVSPDNILYLNEGSYSGMGDFWISLYGPKQVHPIKGSGFTSGGYAGGGVQVYSGQCFVGYPEDNSIQIWQLPAKPKYKFTNFATESSGDYFTLDEASQYLYSIGYGSQTLQIYNFKNGRLLDVIDGFNGGVTVDPVVNLL